MTEQNKIYFLDDDSEFNLQMGRRLKKFPEYSYYFFNTIDELLHAIKNDKPKLFIIDLNLKGKDDGITIVKKIKPEYNIPFIFISSIIKPEVLERAKSCNPYGYLIKPFSETQLILTIEIALKRFETEQNLAKATLHANETKFRLKTIWDNSKDAARLLNSEGIIIDVNDTFCKIFEKKRTELVGNSFEVLYTSERGEELISKFKERYDANSLPDFQEVEVHLWNGKKILVQHN